MVSLEPQPLDDPKGNMEEIMEKYEWILEL